MSSWGHHVWVRQGPCTTLYHATNWDAADEIVGGGEFCLGEEGLMGGAIYFSTNASNAQNSSKNGNGVVLVAEVRMGRTLYISNYSDRDPTMTLEKLLQMGYDSVEFESNTGTSVAIYDPKQVVSVRRK